MAIAVVVGDGRAHPCLVAAVFIEGRACGYGDVGECSIVIIVVENARGTVAGNVNIGPAIFVKIEGGNAEGIMAVGAVDVRFHGYVLECAVALVVVKNILRAGQSAWAAHYRDALPNAGCAITWRGRVG